MPPRVEGWRGPYRVPCEDHRLVQVGHHPVALKSHPHAAAKIRKKQRAVGMTGRNLCRSVAVGGQSLVRARYFACYFILPLRRINKVEQNS